MKKNVIIMSAIAFTIIGCNSNRDNNGNNKSLNNSNTKDITGKVSDPAIKNAKVTLKKEDGTTLTSCGAYEDMECTVWTKADGTFKFTVGKNVDISSYKIRSEGGFDTKLNAPITNIFYKDANDISNLIVTPLSTLVYEFHKKDQGLYSEAVQKVANIFSLEPNQVNKDPESDTKILKASYLVNKIGELVVENGVSVGESFNHIIKHIENVTVDNSTDFNTALQNIFKNNTVVNDKLVKDVINIKASIDKIESTDVSTFISSLDESEKFRMFKEQYAKFNPITADGIYNKNITTIFDTIYRSFGKNIVLRENNLRQIAGYIYAMAPDFKNLNVEKQNLETTLTEKLNDVSIKNKIVNIAKGHVNSVDVPLQVALKNNKEKMDYYFNSEIDNNYKAVRLLDKIGSDTVKDNIYSYIVQNYSNYGYIEKASGYANEIADHTKRRVALINVASGYISKDKTYAKKELDILNDEVVKIYNDNLDNFKGDPLGLRNQLSYLQSAFTTLGDKDSMSKVAKIRDMRATINNAQESPHPREVMRFFQHTPGELSTALSEGKLESLYIKMADYFDAVKTGNMIFTMGPMGGHSEAYARTTYSGNLLRVTIDFIEQYPDHEDTPKVRNLAQELRVYMDEHKNNIDPSKEESATSFYPNMIYASIKLDNDLATAENYLKQLNYVDHRGDYVSSVGVIAAVKMVEDIETGWAYLKNKLPIDSKVDGKPVKFYNLLANNDASYGSLLFSSYGAMRVFYKNKEYDKVLTLLDKYITFLDKHDENVTTKDFNGSGYGITTLFANNNTYANYPGYRYTFTYGITGVLMNIFKIKNIDTSNTYLSRINDLKTKTITIAKNFYNKMPETMLKYNAVAITAYWDKRLGNSSLDEYLTLIEQYKFSTIPSTPKPGGGKGPGKGSQVKAGQGQGGSGNVKPGQGQGGSGGNQQPDNNYAKEKAELYTLKTFDYIVLKDINKDNYESNKAKVEEYVNLAKTEILKIKNQDKNRNLAPVNYKVTAYTYLTSIYNRLQNSIEIEKILTLAKKSINDAKTKNEAQDDQLKNAYSEVIATYIKYDIIDDNMNKAFTLLKEVAPLEADQVDIISDAAYDLANMDDFPDNSGVFVDFDKDGKPDFVVPGSEESIKSEGLELDTDIDNDGTPDSEDLYPYNLVKQL